MQLALLIWPLAWLRQDPLPRTISLVHGGTRHGAQAGGWIERSALPREAP